MLIENEEMYNYAVSKGYEPLIDKRFPMEISLRKRIQKEKFGGNSIKNNSKFYKYCLLNKPLICENCLTPIKNPSAVNVSHILTRGAYPELAHDPRNTSILCFNCHNNYEHSTTRGKLRPSYISKTEKIKEQLKKEYDIKRVSKESYDYLPSDK